MSDSNNSRKPFSSLLSRNNATSINRTSNTILNDSSSTTRSALLTSNNTTARSTTSFFNSNTARTTSPLSTRSTTPDRGQFTPSRFPGATEVSIQAQLAGFKRVQEKQFDDHQISKVAIHSREVTEMQYRRFASFIEKQSGIVLGDGKQYLVNSRLSTLLIRFNIPSIDDLIDKAMDPIANKEISSAVIDAMTTNETLWFRDTYPYLALKNLILPEFAMQKKSQVRIWSAACSSGQEPYSIAMVIQEQSTAMNKVDPSQCQILATDISPEMLARSKAGLYDNHALARGLSLERKQKFFNPTEDPNVMSIDNSIKQMVQFRQLNLLSTFNLLGKFDVIFCRNVLIYFNNEVKASILEKFASCLNPKGYLILGSSESISGLTDKYDMVRCNPGLAYRLK